MEPVKKTITIKMFIFKHYLKYICVFILKEYKSNTKEVKIWEVKELL
jgi:hypothetical protein